LPVLRALQGHPESGRLWVEHINSILSHPELGFVHTTHDRTIYISSIRSENILLLRQVDDFSIACSDESIAKDVNDIIGRSLQLPTETSPPFKYLGLQSEFKGVDIEQSSTYIAISCHSYISRLLKSHGWDNPSPRESTTDHQVAPLPHMNCCFRVKFGKFRGKDRIALNEARSHIYHNGVDITTAAGGHS
jgi:hypothetical protein